LDICHECEKTPQSVISSKRIQATVDVRVM